MKIIHTFVVLAYKESEYLEECIKSVINQKYKSNIVIATSTPNDFITKLAKKYKLNIIVNDNHKSIGADFDFAIKCGNTELVTIAHQDDIYDYDYSYDIVESYKNNKENLKIKRILLKPLLNINNSNKISKKIAVLKYGCSIGCPSVTFKINRIKYPIFDSDFKCDVDWNAWERLSKLDGKFIYINKYLMGHRIHEDSTTTEIIHDNIRTKEDLVMFKRFWKHPSFVAKIINKFYKYSEINNEVKKS